MLYFFIYFSSGLVLVYCLLNYRVKLIFKEDMLVCFLYTDVYISVVKWFVNKENDIRINFD